MTTYTVGEGKQFSSIQEALDAVPGFCNQPQRVEICGYQVTIDCATGWHNGSAEEWMAICPVNVKVN